MEGSTSVGASAQHLLLPWGWQQLETMLAARMAIQGAQCAFVLDDAASSAPSMSLFAGKAQ